MITCHITYWIDPAKLEAFERYGRVWITLVGRHGGTHHGYLLPSEGESDVAIASFTFASMAAYEAYRTASLDDDDCQAALAFAVQTGCIRRYSRTFLRPQFDGLDPSEINPTRTAIGF